jgi:fluoride exporter
MNPAVIAAVGIGGGLGALLRYAVDGAIQPAWWPGFPFGIFVVNISGGFAMGLITALATLKFQLPLEWRSFLTTGILGGYTTFSTFSLQSALLLERGAYGQAAIYIGGSTLLSILAIFVGFWIVRGLYA